MQSLEGVVLGARYRLGAPLGRGGMGEVHSAIDEAIGRPVAIKILSGEGEANRARFEREARIVARLAHPHIVGVSDFRTATNEPSFIVMERLVGESLGEILARERTIAPVRIARIAMQTLSALAAAHQAGVVHRDVKPDNVFIASTDSGEHVKLLDFGVAKPLDATALTQGGAIIGTVRFMAPEQVLGAPVDARTDVYALGATMYRALAGVPPFSGKVTEVLEAIVLRDPAPLAVDPALASIVARAMAKNPADRFASARQMAHALAAWLHPSPVRASRRGEWAALAISAVILVAGATAFVASMHSHVAKHVEATPVAATTSSSSIPLAIPSTIAAASASVAPLPSTPPAAITAPLMHHTPAAPVFASTHRAPSYDAPVRPGFTSDGALIAGNQRVRVKPQLRSNASDLRDDVVQSALEGAAWYELLQYRALGNGALPSGTVTVAFEIVGSHATRGMLRATTFADRSFANRVAIMVGATHFPNAPPTASGEAIVVYTFTVE